jgi:hypothetical protein
VTRFDLKRGVWRDFSSFAFYGWLLLAAVVGLSVARLPWTTAVGLLGGTAVLLLTFIQPLLGLGVTLLLGPLGAAENLLWGGSLLDSGQLMLFITVAAWLARRLSQRRLVLPTTPLNVPFLVFLAATFLTLLPAPSLAFGLKEWVKWLEILVVMWLVVDLAGELKGEENGDSCQATGARCCTPRSGPGRTRRSWSTGGT